LEQLLWRDGLSLGEACEVLLTASGGTLARGDLERLAARLPDRQKRRFESDETLANFPSAEPLPDDGVASSERRVRASEVWRALGEALEQFPDEDRLVLTMRYVDGRTVAEIAGALRLDQKRLYRRIDALLGSLRRRLETAGIGADDARDLLAHVQARMDEMSPFDAALAEIRAAKPSMEQGASSGAR
jgi:RNA polymerase sigma factor for flagellar operon FliA